MIEFDQDDWAVNPVVEDRARPGAPVPREPGLIDVGLDVREPNAGVRINRPADVRRCDGRERPRCHVPHRLASARRTDAEGSRECRRCRSMDGRLRAQAEAGPKI
jgi:hypothetical protein